MRNGTLFVLLLIGVAGILFQKGILRFPQPKAPPVVEQPEEPTVVPEPAPAPEPTPEPPAEPPPPPPPPDPIEQVRDCLRRQATLELPHPLTSVVRVEADSPYVQATVIRIEPDGIHVRLPTGLEKIGYEKLPGDWREAYFIRDDVAAFYRAETQKRRLAAQPPGEDAATSPAAAPTPREMQAQTRAKARAETARREREEALRLQEEADRRDPELRRRRQVWIRFDKALKRYNDAARNTKSTNAEGELVSKRLPPYPEIPPFLRPDGIYPEP